MGGSRPLFCSTLWVLVCVRDPQPIFHDLHPIFLALPWPAQPHPLFLECHTGMGAENWRLCVFSSPPTLHYVKSLIHLLWCHRRYCWSWATLSPRQTSSAPAVSVHKESAVIPGSLVAWAGLAAVGPSLPWVLSKVWPNKHWAGGGKTPALPCPWAVARLLLLLLSPARARCWLVLRLPFAVRTLGLFWELLSPATLLFTHLIDHFSRCNIPTGWKEWANLFIS